MTQTTLELYTALVEAGIPKEKAEKVAQSVLSREEAKDLLVTKSEFYKGLMSHTAIIITAVGLMLAFFK